MPLDRRGHWYRYHHLFRDMRLAELQRLEPGMMAVLRRRAAAWCLANGLAEEALEYSMAAEDVDQAADLLVHSLNLRTYRQGRVATLQRWFRWLDDRGGIEAHPIPLPAHDQVAGVFAVPEARGHLPQPGGRPIPEAGAPGKVRPPFHVTGKRAVVPAGPGALFHTFRLMKRAPVRGGMVS